MIRMLNTVKYKVILSKTLLSFAINLAELPLEDGAWAAAASAGNRPIARRRYAGSSARASSILYSALQVRAHMAIHAREAVSFDAKVRDCQPVGLPLIAVSQLEATFLSFCAYSWPPSSPQGKGKSGNGEQTSTANRNID